MYEQLSLFDSIQKENDFPCDDCVFSSKCGVCTHVEAEDCFCVRGSFRIRHSQTICHKCGKQMEVMQSDFDSDGAKCKCGTYVIYKNRGNRPTAFQLWKRGQLVGR